MMLAHDIKLLLFLLLLSLHGCDNIWISSSQLHLGKKHNACWPRNKDVACNETNLMLHTCHQWTPLQLPVGGGWWVVRGLQDSLPQVRQVKCCVKISSGQTPRQVHKSGLSSGLGKGSLYSGSVSGSASPCGFRFWNRTTCAALSIARAKWNAGDIIGKHKLYKPNAVLVFSRFPVPLFSSSFLCRLTA